MPMLISCSYIVVAFCYFIMAQLIAFKFNQIIIKLEQLLADSWCHQIQLTNASTLALWGVLTGSIVMPLAGASNKGRLWARATLIK